MWVSKFSLLFLSYFINCTDISKIFIMVKNIFATVLRGRDASWEENVAPLFYNFGIYGAPVKCKFVFQPSRTTSQ